MDLSESEFYFRLCLVFKRGSYKRNRIGAHPVQEEERHDASQWPRQKGKAEAQEEELDANGEAFFIPLTRIPVCCHSRDRKGFPCKGGQSWLAASRRLGGG